MSESQPVSAAAIFVLRVPFRVDYKLKAYNDLAKVKEVVQKELLHHADGLVTRVQCSNYDLERLPAAASVSESLPAALSRGALIDDIGAKLATIRSYADPVATFGVVQESYARDDLLVLLGRLDSIQSAMRCAFDKTRG